MMTHPIQALRDIAKQVPTALATGLRDDRAQTYTISAIIMSVVLLTGLVFALSSIPSGENALEEDYSQRQLQETAEDIMVIAQTHGGLEDAALYWDNSEATWVDANGRTTYTTLPPGHPLYEPLNSILTSQSKEYILDISYQQPSGGTEDRDAVVMGSVGANAGYAEARITIQDDTELVGPDSGTTVSDSSSFYAPDAYPNSERYNTLTLRLLVWDS